MPPALLCLSWRNYIPWYTFSIASENKPTIENRPHSTRRQFIRLLGLGAAGAALLPQVALHPSVTVEEKSRAMSPELNRLLITEFGVYTQLLSYKQLLDDLNPASLICIGESHFVPEDMQTAFEISRSLASRKPITLGLERFTSLHQPQLNRLPQLPPSKRRAAVDEIFAGDEYQQSWGDYARNTLGLDLDPQYRIDFENLIHWAAQEGIPLIGLDAPTAERQLGLDDLAQRNRIWADRLRLYAADNPERQLVVIGGSQHIDNTPDSLPSLSKVFFPPQSVVSIGQRYANISPKSFRRIETLAHQSGFRELIIKQPEFAPTASTQALLHQPPDYWIAVHSPKPL